MEQNAQNKEAFEKFKAEMIEILQNLKFEDDPHVALVHGKGHGESSILCCACNGWIMETGLEFIARATGHTPKVAVMGKGNVQFMGKGGES